MCLNCARAASYVSPITATISPQARALTPYAVTLAPTDAYSVASCPRPAARAHLTVLGGFGLGARHPAASLALDRSGAASRCLACKYTPPGGALRAAGTAGTPRRVADTPVAR